MARTLKAYRLDAGLTQAELAERAGVSLSTVILAELGKRRPHPPNRKKIADVLGARVTDILEFANGDAPPTTA
jgi:transcriptional regulator with XRE-family HTH domain